MCAVTERENRGGRYTAVTERENRGGRQAEVAGAVINERKEGHVQNKENVAEGNKPV